MQVPKTELQHQVMIEAVENHMPQVIIIDEIGTELEVLAAQTIAEKGVQLVGTTHGNCLENLIKNPPLSNLIGGIQYVTLSDEEAKRRGTQKSILERKSYPAFEVIIEINDSNLWTIHEDVAASADSFLRDDFLPSQIRCFTGAEKIQIQYNELLLRSNSFGKILTNNIELSSSLIRPWDQLNNIKTNQLIKRTTKLLVIYPYCISVNVLKEVFYKSGIHCVITNNLNKASLIIGLNQYLEQNQTLKQFVLKKKIPVYSLNQVSIYQLKTLIKLLIVI
jgi:hypothetical protein